MVRQPFGADAGDAAVGEQEVACRRGLDAELGVGTSGGDLGVGAGVDVGVHAESDRRRRAARHRDLGEHLQRREDWKSVVEGKTVTEREGLGGRRICTNKKNTTLEYRWL